MFLTWTFIGKIERNKGISIYPCVACTRGTYSGKCSFKCLQMWFAPFSLISRECGCSKTQFQIIYTDLKLFLVYLSILALVALVFEVDHTSLALTRLQCKSEAQEVFHCLLRSGKWEVKLFRFKIWTRGPPWAPIFNPPSQNQVFLYFQTGFASDEAYIQHQSFMAPMFWCENNRSEA